MCPERIYSLYATYRDFEDVLGSTHVQTHLPKIVQRLLISNTFQTGLLRNPVPFQGLLTKLGL